MVKALGMAEYLRRMIRRRRQHLRTISRTLLQKQASYSVADQLSEFVHHTPVHRPFCHQSFCARSPQL